ncbi:MAG: lamin tail domain-containing protein, partial [Phycisphaerales bacterium]
VGATTIIGTAAPQGKAVFPQCGVWQNVEFSLIPGVEPVISFAGGDGNLNPDGGLYSIDALFFSINTIDPHAGPYDVFLDHMYIIDAANNEVVLSDVEDENPFPWRRYNPPDPAWYSTIISGLASYDGRYSNRLQWEFNNANTDNSFAAYRLYPGWPFADTAKAFGIWLLVEDCATNGPPRPSLPEMVIGDAPAVTVDDLDPAATAVQLYVNGSPDTLVPNPGVTTIDIAPTATLALLDQVTATQTTAALGESAPSRPRVVSVPLAPTVEPPAVPGESSVTVSGVMTETNATASTVTVYIDGGSPSTAAGGTETVVVSTPTLNDGEAITATQTVNGVESAESAAVTVAVPRPTVQAPLDIGDTLVTVNGLHPTATTVTVHVNTTTYPQATGGASTVVVTVPSLNRGDAVKATQTIAGIVGPFSNTVVVANSVVINEFSYDDYESPDIHQFIELHNSADIPIDISGWYIEVGDYETAIDPYVYYTITVPAATTISAGGYWTVGQQKVKTQIPGAIVDLVNDTRMDDGMSYLALRNSAGVMLDAVGWETNNGPNLGYVYGPPEAEADIYFQIGPGIWGNHVHAVDPATSQSRWLDGLDTNNNGRDFGIQIATPGFSNNLSDLMPYSQNANALSVGDSVPDWVFSYMPLRAADPATVDTVNPSVIPASPDGGNVMIGWDEAGGGNACYMSQLAKEDFTLETYIYIPPTYSPDGWGYEETRIGVRGSTGGLHNFGYYSNSTGLCWFWQRGESWHLLWLFDENDGGDEDWPDPYPYARYLGGIGIAENDPDTTGWQRLMLEVSGDKVRGIFGGTYGSRGDGMKFSGTHDSPGPGGIYVSYREAMTGTGIPDNRPPTLDAISLTDPPLDGDIDLDDDVDLADLVKFVECMNGPDVSTPPGGCTLDEFGLADLEWDNDVDLGDFAEFQMAFP